MLLLLYTTSSSLAYQAKKLNSNLISSQPSHHILVFLPGCVNEMSDVFCKRFRQFCPKGGENGKLLRTKCRFSCGCPWWEVTRILTVELKTLLEFKKSGLRRLMGTRRYIKWNCKDLVADPGRGGIRIPLSDLRVFAFGIIHIESIAKPGSRIHQNALFMQSLKSQFFLGRPPNTPF